MNITVIELLSDIEVNPILRFMKGVPKFTEFTKKYKPDIIHFNLSDSVDLLYVQSAKNGIKIRIAHSHNSSVNSISKKIAHLVLKKSCNILQIISLLVLKRQQNGYFLKISMKTANMI